MKMTPRLIIIGGLAVVLTVVAFVVFLPTVVFKPTPTMTTHQYTPLEQEGRDLYVSNGCMYCHSQFTRPGDVTPSRVSEAGQYAFDQPHQLGTLRTGPDLANIGMKRGEQWEINHFIDPRKYSPNSIMPSFRFLSERQMRALAAYLDTLGNKQTASTDLMVPVRFLGTKFERNKFELTEENFARGRDIYAKRCLTCHGCAGKGDGPYAMINNARPANLRDSKYKNLPVNYFFWRISDGVPGTVMPEWKQSMTDDEMWLVMLFEEKAFMNMTPAFTDEGDMPEQFANKKLAAPTLENLEKGKAIFVANCAFCHGYSGAGDGPDAAGLLPGPPNFDDDALYVPWADGDWIWRVSESLPMRAMPQWKTWLDEEQVSLVAGYVKNVLSLPKDGAEPADPEIPADIDKNLKMPADTDLMRGRQVYLQRCWMCHGDAGQSDGPSGGKLQPVPATFIEPALKKFSDGEWFYKVSYGIGNAAMPQWHLLLSPEDRWATVKYIKHAFVNPSEPTVVSDDVPPAYVALDPAPYSPTPETMEQGKQLYATLCTGCHGAKAMGDGDLGVVLLPTPANLTEEPGSTTGIDFWYWRLDQGVVGDNGKHPTAMPAWINILTDQQKWAVVFYTRGLAGAVGGPDGSEPTSPTAGSGN